LRSSFGSRADTGADERRSTCLIPHLVVFLSSNFANKLRSCCDDYVTVIRLRLNVCASASQTFPVRFWQMLSLFSLASTVSRVGRSSFTLYRARKLRNSNSTVRSQQ